MNALNQYIELFKDNSDLIDRHSATPINALRKDALQSLLSRPLPKADSDNYENCDLNSMLLPDYGMNLAKINIDVNLRNTFRCDVPTLSTRLSMLVNDTYAKSAGDWNLPEGVEVSSLREVAIKNPNLISRYYGKSADIGNPMVALDTLFAQDGYFLHVKEGVKLSAPLQLVNILESSVPLMAVRRLLIIVENDAEAKLLVCDHTQNPEVDFLNLETVEIFIGKNASFDYYSLEESSPKTTRISTLYLEQDSGSKVSIDGLTLFNGKTRNEYYCRFTGENAELKLYGLAIEDESREISTYTRISHDVPQCKSDELFKYTVDDQSSASFTGRIYVDYGANGTEAYQANRNIVGSDSAKIKSRPELEIYNDDVKCSHGSAIGQLDPMQLFYMRTRGLDENDAKLLLKQAFMADVIENIGIPSLRDKLHIMIERRFAGEKSACRNCTAIK